MDEPNDIREEHELDSDNLEFSDMETNINNSPINNNVNYS